MADLKPENSSDAGLRNEAENKASKTEKDVKLVKKEKEQKKTWEGIKRYFSETKAELKKIVWPTPKQVLNNTGVVLLFMLIVGAFIWALDALTSTGFKEIISLFAK